MVTRDLFEHEIGLALRKLFGLLEDLKQENKFPEATTAAQLKLKELFSIDSAEIFLGSEAQFLTRIERHESDYVRELGNLLFEMANMERLQGNKNASSAFVEKAELAFQLAEKKSKTVHFEIIAKLEKMKEWKSV
jgi:hypothetical protein